MQIKRMVVQMSKRTRGYFFFTEHKDRGSSDHYWFDSDLNYNI